MCNVIIPLAPCAMHLVFMGLLSWCVLGTERGIIINPHLLTMIMTAPTALLHRATLHIGNQLAELPFRVFKAYRCQENSCHQLSALSTAFSIFLKHCLAIRAQEKQGPETGRICVYH